MIMVSESKTIELLGEEMRLRAPMLVTQEK